MTMQVFIDVLHAKWEKVRDAAVVTCKVAGVILAVLLVVLGIIAIINSVPVLEDGIVMDMSFRAARTEMQISITTDSSGNTHTQTRPVHYPNRWAIQVVGTKDDGKARSEWWDVGEGMYNQIDIGDEVHRNVELDTVSIIRKAIAE